MREQLIRYYFEPENYMKTGCLDYSETFRHPTPEQVADALKIGLKFKLWMILHPDYFWSLLPSFESRLMVSNKMRGTNFPKVDWVLISKMCTMCPYRDIDSGLNSLVSFPNCPKVTPRFFGKGTVKMVETKTDLISKEFPCLEWVRHV